MNWDDEAQRILDGFDPSCQAMSSTLFDIYSSLVGAGFSEEQAFTLLLRMVD